MARRIKLTRDERILLGSILNGSAFMMSAAAYNHTEQKLRNRGLIDDGGITDDGRRAMAENRQTKPKVG